MAGLLAGPWAVRNQRELGAPIFFRDNFGLELAIANCPGAVHPADPRLAYRTRMTDIQTMQLTEAQLRPAGAKSPISARWPQRHGDGSALIPGISSLYAGAGWFRRASDVSSPRLSRDGGNILLDSRPED